MDEKIIKLIEDFTDKKNIFKGEEIDYNCVKVKTSYAQSLYKLRFKDFYSPLIEKVREVEYLLKNLDAYDEDFLLTHGLRSQNYSIVVFTNVETSKILAILSSKSL